MQQARALAGPAGVAALGVAGCAAIWLADPTTPGGVLPVCPSYGLFGVLCPGCGGTRMVYSLLHGDLGAAVQYNALALVALPLVIAAWGVWTLRLARGRPYVPRPRPRWVLPVALAVVALWFVARNLPFEPFTALRV